MLAFAKLSECLNYFQTHAPNLVAIYGLYSYNSIYAKKCWISSLIPQKNTVWLMWVHVWKTYSWFKAAVEKCKLPVGPYDHILCIEVYWYTHLWKTPCIQDVWIQWSLWIQQSLNTKTKNNYYYNFVLFYAKYSVETLSNVTGMKPMHILMIIKCAVYKVCNDSESSGQHGLSEWLPKFKIIILLVQQWKITLKIPL